METTETGFSRSIGRIPMERGLIAGRKNWQPLRGIDGGSIPRWIPIFFPIIVPIICTFVVTFTFCFLLSFRLQFFEIYEYMFRERKRIMEIKFNPINFVVTMIKQLHYSDTNTRWILERVFTWECLETVSKSRATRRQLIFHARCTLSFKSIQTFLVEILSLPSNIVNATCELGRLN